MLKLNIPKLFSRPVQEEYAVVVPEFETQYYFDNYPDVQKSGTDPCLHYINFGWKEGRNPASWFDTAAYLRQNPDVRDAGVNPFYHYLKFGRAENRRAFAPLADGAPGLSDSGSPDRAKPLLDLEAMARSGLFSPEIYAQWTGGAFPALADTLNDAIQRGSIPIAALRCGPAAAARLLLEFGNVARSRQLLSQAQNFYLAAHEQDPSLFHAPHQLGDCFLDVRGFGLAAHFYKTALDINDQYFWTHANLAKALHELSRYEEAVRHARRAHEIEPGSVFAELLARSLCHRSGHRLIGSGFAAARSREFSRCRQLMNEAAAVGPARPARGEALGARTPAQPLKVAILADDALPQCLLYRVTNKAYQLETQDAAVKWFRKGDVQQFEDELAFADVAIFYRVPATPEIVDAIRYARSIGKPTFYEIDDLIFSSDHYPEPYESYANLISWEEYCGLVGGAELFRLAMRECDFGIASTAPLAEHMKAEVLTGEVIVVPNSFGPPHLRQLAANRRPERKRAVELFYGSGTLAHKQDFEEFARGVLVPLLEKFPETRLTLAGSFTALSDLTKFGSRVTRIPTNWDFEQYLTQLRKADINIAVLKPSTFNDCKSEIKWLEAAMMGIPSVLSRTETHRLTVDDGRTGFLCDGKQEWVAALDRLIADGDLRRAVGRAAQDAVTKTYAAPVVGANLLKELTARAGPVKPPHRLRVTIVHVFYPPQAIGGATRVVKENVDSLRRRYGDDIEVQVFTTTEGGERPGTVRQYVEDGVLVTALTVQAHDRWEWEPKSEEVRRAFARYLEFAKPDIVHFHCIQRLTGSVIEATREAGIPYLVTVHDGWWLSDHQFLVDGRGVLHVGEALSVGAMTAAKVPQESIDRTLYLRRLLAGAEAVLAVSPSFAQVYRDTGLTNVRAIENGTIELEPVPRDLAASDKVRLGFIGGLAVHKGYGLLWQVWSTNTFQNLELVLVDHALPELMTKSGSWNGNTVSIVGRVRQDRIRDLYASLDVLLAVSLWPESYGLVTREAAQAGLWLVASDRGAIGDVVEEGRNGFRIDVSDVTELERVLLAIDAAPEKYRKRTGHPVVLRSFDEQVDELIEVYREVAGRENEIKSAETAQDRSASPAESLSPTLAVVSD